MKNGIMAFCIVFWSQFSHANQVAQCLGTLALDFTPVTAKVYDQPNGGEIIIETSIDTVKGTTKISYKADEEVEVYDNPFQMSFTATYDSPAHSVQAFRDGAFFVEDFYCIRVR